MTGSLMFMLVLGLGVAVPFAKSGKPVGDAFKISLIAVIIGGALFFGGLQLDLSHSFWAALCLPWCWASWG